MFDVFQKERTTSDSDSELSSADSSLSDDDSSGSLSDSDEEGKSHRKVSEHYLQQ